MKQCNHLIKGGSKCGKDAIPGTRHCAIHKPAKGSFVNHKPKTSKALRPKIQPSEYNQYLASDEWKRKAQSEKTKNPRCSLCNRGESLRVHHRTYKRCGNEIPGDLIVLCENCHALFHEFYEYNYSENRFTPR